MSYVIRLILIVIITCFELATAHAQDNIITFTPSTPLCIGEKVVMICFEVPTSSETFISATALISFNGSNAAAPTTINGNTLVGIDTTRYTADTVGLNISTNRPGVRLTISDYQATDGYIVFACHGVDSDLQPSVAVITRSPQRLASPPSSPPVTLSEPNNNCTNILISWTTPDSDRDITEYSVYRNNTFLITTTDNDYTDTNQLTINTVYEYSVTAISCAGHSTPGVDTVSLGVFSLTQLSLSYDNTTYEVYLHWDLKNPYQSPIIILQYSLLLIYSYTQGSTTYPYSSTITFSQLFTDTDYTLSLSEQIFYSNEPVLIDITALLSITDQCRVPVSGVTLAVSYTLEYTSSTNTTSNTSRSLTTPSSTAVTQEFSLNIIPIILIIFILIVSIFVISILSIVIMIMCYKNKNLKSNAKPTEPVHLYQYIDMDTVSQPVSPVRTADPYYTPMEPACTHSSPQDSSSVNTPQYSNLK